MAKERIELLGVPVDVLQPENLEKELLEIMAHPGHKQIIFLSIWDLLKARKKRSDFGECVKNADLILPISKSILKGAAFLGKTVPVRYNPFPTTINIFSFLDQYCRSLYFLGSRKKSLQQAERNVRGTFPTLRIVGRYVGFYPQKMEKNIVEAIYKASPSLVLVGEGIKEKECWSYRRRNSFSSSTFLYYRDAIGIFSNRIKRVDEEKFDKGREIYFELAHNPLKIFLLFPFMKYKILLLWDKFFKKNAPAASQNASSNAPENPPNTSEDNQ